ncbi:MAG TPA: hypothetical protein VHW64_04390 [Nocardioides sp.]|jgi:hypothetical protein|uniref:hypothetical protein n=1 Tax=Nocardioides sp. TaxID=35761 RepID=UPI002E33BCB7|nr:hypothetical protein [Nocardioides sp.]HEX3929916.1 hypothetical protein [Nocardioides sp.]
MTETTTRPTQSMTDPSAAARQDRPSPVAQSAAAPATITVANNLTDDAILATEMLVGAGANSQALFANPFAADREEMLFVDIAGNLLWLTHDADGAWQTVPLMDAPGKPATALEVATAVHLDGTVFALALDARGLRSWRLIPRADGSALWLGGDETPFKDARGLQVQYLPERPARPVVLFLYDHGGLLTLHGMVAVASPRNVSPWLAYDVLRALDPKLLTEHAVAFYGLDSPKGTARIYTIDKAGTVWCIYGDRDKSTRKSLGAAEDLAGIWHSPDGIGCIALRAHNPSGHPGIHTITTMWPQGDLVRSVDAYVDSRLLEVTLWEDGDGRYHLYGLVDGDLRVVHQAGLRFWEREVPVPDWESRQATVNGEEITLAVSRPLTGSVNMYALDGFPDQYPSQHVMHVPGSVPDAERCVIMTQDVTTTWWSREVVRLRAAHKPYKMKMHESRLTLTSQAGGPIANCSVTLTADRAVDFRIGGEFYRCGPEHPVTATTDHRGVIRLSTVARDLIGCTIHATAVGLPDGTSFNPVTPLHSFLGGTGTLPMHQNGISEDGLRDARTADGRWVFPAWHGQTSLAVLPEPREVLDWCRHAYEAKAGTAPLTTSTTGVPIPLRGVVLQTWDPSRPAYEEVTTADRQAELVAARVVGADEWEAGSLGDIFLGIGSGLVTVVETGVDFLEGTASVVIKWVEGTLLHLKLLWAESENPFQFIQAVVNELEGDVEDVIDWLSWVFDWSDILATAEQLRFAGEQIPDLVNPQLEYFKTEIVDNWFDGVKESVHEFFITAKDQMVGQTFSNKPKAIPTLVPLGGAKNPPSSVLDPQEGLAPKTNWLHDWLCDHADGDIFGATAEASTPPEFLAAAEAFVDLMTFFDDDRVAADFWAGVEDLGRLWTNLFDVTDLQSLARIEVVTFMDLLEDMIDLLLDLADAAVDRLITLVEKVLACLPAILEIDILKDSVVGWIWEFICDEAGIEHRPVKLGDIGFATLALPMNVVSKALWGQAPFPGGFPDLRSTLDPRPHQARAGAWFPPGSEHYAPEDYVVPPGWQAGVQGVTGIAQILFAGVDMYMDSRSVAGSNSPPSNDFERLQIAFICFSDFFGFGSLDMPVFWGCNWLQDADAADKLWWAEYLLKMVIYSGDICCAVAYPALTSSPIFTGILGTMQGNFGNAMITALGLGELAVSISLCAITGGSTQMAQIWWWSQFLSMWSSVTAFARILGEYQVPDSPLPYVKMATDIGADVGAGIWYMFMGPVAASFEPHPVAKGWPLRVKAGEAVDLELFVTDSVDDLESKAPIFSPIGWRFEDPQNVPPGLAFASADKDFHVKIAGTIASTAGQSDPYVFEVRCASSYDPNISTTRTFKLQVDPAE